MRRHSWEIKLKAENEKLRNPPGADGCFIFFKTVGLGKLAVFGEVAIGRTDL